MLELWNALMYKVRSEEGTALTEYALLLSFIAIACIAVLIILGPQIAAIYTAVSAAL